MEAEEESGNGILENCIWLGAMCDRALKTSLLYSSFQVSTCAYVTQKVELAGIRYEAFSSLDS